MVERLSYKMLTGRTIGTYRLQQLMEEGKSGPIFMAQTRTGVPCIIRFFAAPAELNANERIVALGLFQQEASKIATLQHPHILQLLDHGSYQGMPYLVYPQVPLMSLRARLSQRAALDTTLIGSYLEQIAAALEYAHARTVLHRNLSTNCIYLQENRQLVVTEFGLIHMLELCNRETQARLPFSGSSESSAPEQLLGQATGAAADIYALGAVLYRLLTTQPPFAGQTRDEVSRLHIYAEVPSIMRWRQDVPTAMDEVIAQAMAKEPAQRYRQPGELVQAYYEIVAPVQPVRTARALKQQTEPKARPAHRRKVDKRTQMQRRRTISLLATGMSIGAAALIVVSLRNGHGAAKPPISASAIQLAHPVSTQVASASISQPTTSKGGRLLAQVAEVPLNSAKNFSIANQKNPGLLIHLQDNRFVAFDSTCTHAACSVSYNPQDKMLECPCHGAVFDPARDAAVVQGPAQIPLSPIKIIVNPDGTIREG
ncbi:hypothetical protein EPA93_30085 [Ktedonosporobacter rubrisoli]|uniref:non-specific serine/threonine protein kinase n=1 Tax=Ktedonosporobacter rubrisoli TaxID=2509675 RepID=A0A4P6JWP2_KTERU|nr:protein kinase [Ktedonosporobacter rubrisoli]QBD80004.1 hypothetical protein EPA93_30085 [Ktedonosporobacter rubrisoli]